MTLEQALDRLRRSGTPATVEGMARYGITAERAFGVPVRTIRALAKQIGKDHALALELWDSGWYEARLLAAFVDDPERVTARQMEDWSRDFDSWAVVDTVCFHLFDRAPHAWTKAHEWATRRDEFRRRAGYALMWSLALHDRAAPDEDFLALLPLLEEGAKDGRNFVKKGVDMALRAIGRRAGSNAAATELAERLVASDDATQRWVGRRALKELTERSVGKARTGKARTGEARRGEADPGEPQMGAPGAEEPPTGQPPTGESRPGARRTGARMRR